MTVDNPENAKVQLTVVFEGQSKFMDQHAYIAVLWGLLECEPNVIARMYRCKI